MQGEAAGLSGLYVATVVVLGYGSRIGFLIFIVVRFLAFYSPSAGVNGPICWLIEAILFSDKECHELLRRKGIIRGTMT